jgi:hypothetical protein
VSRTIAPGPHAYPHQLAHLVQQRWAALRPTELGATDLAQRDNVPSLAAIERLLSVCYQASLLYEEGRPVTFRVALAEPESFTVLGGPPAGLHRLVLSQSRPFDEHELRRIAPAAVFQRSLIGVRVDMNDELSVWGLVHSGTRWLQAVRGGRNVEQFIPPVLMAAVTGPGRVLVSKGSQTLGALAGGTLVDEATDVFAAPWLGWLFAELHAAQWAEHSATPDQASGPYGSIDPKFGRQLGEHVLRRIVSTIRGARHGGTLVFLPARHADELVAGGRYFKLKYRFCDEEPRRRIFSLTVQIMNELGRLHARPEAPVGWAEYEASADSRLAGLNEALFEVAHLVAMLADVDGAVIMTDRFEILGFGAEISGELPEVDSVDRSLDLEGAQSIPERTDRVGTRHRSSYRLCQHLENALVIVVSQDGGVRFVRRQEGRVTYFDQIATGPWEV